MCSKKVFGGGSKPKVDPPPAVAVSAPVASNNVESQMNQGETNTQAKGKRKLIINPTMGTGTGVNL